MRFAKQVLCFICALVPGLYVLACVALFVVQRSLIYYPQPRSNTTASTLLVLPLSDGTVAVSAHPHAGPGAVIYFGGNAEDVSKDIPDLVQAFPDRAVFALHYPGYGGSSGSPSQQDIFTAALALFDRTHTEHPDVIVIGRSLGSGVATFLASQRQVSRLVLVTPFDSLADPAASQYPFVPVRWLMLDRFESGKYAPEVTAPTTMIVAADDEIVPRSSSDRLHTRFREGEVAYIVLPNVGHNTIQDSPGYWELLSKP